jgi:hypothetical protein
MMGELPQYIIGASLLVSAGKRTAPQDNAKGNVMAKRPEWSPAFLDGKPNQDSYAGFVDGEHWATLLGCFEDWV